MNELLHWLSQLFSSWKCWIVIAPWEIGVRVRLGRNATALVPGPHWRIPFIDEITLVNTRMRISSTPAITIPGSDGKARVVTANIGYLVADPLLALMRFTDPLSAVLSIAQAEVATGKPAVECEARLQGRFRDTGVAIEFLRFVEDVEIPALRLLQYGGGVSDGIHGVPPSIGNTPRY